MISNENDNNGRLESYLKFLIKYGLVDNDDDSSETIHRFLQLYE